MRRLLRPAEWLYRAGLWGVQGMYRLGLRKVHRLSVPVISVGNLTWGGTGKTPLVMQLALGLKQRGYSPAVLTRGYGKDEARLLSERLFPIPVMADPDRVAAGRRAIEEAQANLLLLDDGYQQWRLKKDLEILAVDATAPFGNGRLIPGGSLREPKASAARADLIVVTKTELDPQGAREAQRELSKFNPTAPIFFARTKPTGLIRWPSETRISLESLRGARVCTLAGIARPETFEATVKRLGAQVNLKVRVPDHHPYTAGELIRLWMRCQRHGVDRVVTTAKDAARIPQGFYQALGPQLKGIHLLVLEVVLELEPNEGEFFHRIDSLLAGQRN